MTSLDSYITLGRSGLRVSPLTLGTMTFGEDWGWGASPETSEAILAEYLDRGGNVVDTANVYTNGHSEKIVGDFFAARPGLRERVVLSTKFFGNLHPGDPNGGGGGRKALIAQLDESLRPSSVSARRRSRSPGYAAAPRSPPRSSEPAPSSSCGPISPRWRSRSHPSSSPLSTNRRRRPSTSPPPSPPRSPQHSASAGRPWTASSSRCGRSCSPAQPATERRRRHAASSMPSARASPASARLVSLVQRRRVADERSDARIRGETERPRSKGMRPPRILVGDESRAFARSG
jgi:hypothetical protein